MDQTESAIIDTLLFDAKTVSNLKIKFDSLPAYLRPALFETATSPALEPLRLWLELQYADLPKTTRNSFASRLRSPNHFVQAVSEIATEAILIRAGYSVDFEPKFSNLTPDLLARDSSGNGLLIEVWTRSIDKTITKQALTWHSLTDKLKEIDAGLVLRVSSSDPDRSAAPPKQESLMRIKHEVVKWLVDSNVIVGDSFESEGFIFQSEATSQSGHVEVIPVTQSVTVDRMHVLKAIATKVQRYKHLASELNLPLITVISSTNGTGLDREFVHSVLKGKNSTAIKFGIGTFGPIVLRPVTLLNSEEPPTFNPILSAVAWLDVNSGENAQLTIWPLAGANHTLPPITTSGVQFETV